MKKIYQNIEYRFLMAIAALILLLPSLKAQSCYEIISDNTGMDITSYQSELEAAACALRDAFPEEFQSQFKVYDFGFYLYNELMEGGNESIWTQVQEEVNATYYLVFGRIFNEKNSKNKIIVYLNLPTEGGFECLDLISPNSRSELPLKLEAMALENLNVNYNYYTSELVVIDHVAEVISKIIECCDQEEEFRENESCFSPCWYTPYQQLQILKDKGFFFEFANISSDPDYSLSTLKENNDGTTRSVILPLDITIDFGSNSILSVDDFIEEIVDNHVSDMSVRVGLSTDVSVFKYKYPRDCGFFENTWNQYNSDASDFKIFVAVVNWDNDFCVLAIHTGTNYTNGNFGNGSNRSGSQILNDELEGLRDVYDDHNQSCSQLVLASASSSGASYYLAQDKFQFKNSEQLKRAKDLYKDAQNNIDEAWYDFNIYWIKEYIAVTKEYENSNCFVACDVRVRIETTWKLCSETIHMALDLCGLEPTVLGPVCDGTNAVLYLISNDLTNATLSAVSLLPIVGYGTQGIKYGGMLWKPLAGCAGGSGFNFAESSSGTNYCRLLQFRVDIAGNIKWGKKSRLREMMAGYINMEGKEAHHLIPWELKNHPILKTLAKKGWHINNPIHNGFPFPTNLHGNHPALNDGVKKILNDLEKSGKITSGMTIPEVITTMKKFTDQLTEECNIAVASGTYVNEHFKKVYWGEIFNNI